MRRRRCIANLNFPPSIFVTLLSTVKAAERGGTFMEKKCFSNMRTFYRIRSDASSRSAANNLGGCNNVRHGRVREIDAVNCLGRYSVLIGDI